MSKSKRTQRRYQKERRNQKTLDSFFSGCGIRACIPELPENAEHPVTGTCSELVTIRQESVEVEIPPLATIQEENVDIETIPSPAIRKENIDNEIPSAIQEELTILGDEYENGWEEDLDECVHGGGVDIRGWQELRQQIKTDLNNRGDTLPITKINQLLVL